MSGASKSSRVLLFLDFDGVLHGFPTPAADADRFCYLGRLEEVLRGCPEVDVVISSTWRLDHPLEFLKELFSEDVRHRVIGVLPELLITGLDDVAGSRYREIQVYLSQEPATAWIALDDDSTLFPLEVMDHVVLCEDGFLENEARLLHRLVLEFEKCSRPVRARPSP